MLVWLDWSLETSEPRVASVLLVVVAAAWRLGKVLMWLSRPLEVKELSDARASLAMMEAKKMSNSTATASNVSLLT